MRWEATDRRMHVTSLDNFKKKLAAAVAQVGSCWETLTHVCTAHCTALYCTAQQAAEACVAQARAGLRHMERVGHTHGQGAPC